jgi:hypothetical protein
MEYLASKPFAFNILVTPEKRKLLIPDILRVAICVFFDLDQPPSSGLE